MKVLVTGATGFIGTWLTRRLVQNGYKVFVLTRKPDLTPELKSLDINPLLGDITNKASVFQASQNVDGIFHLAGLVAYHPDKRYEMEKVNVTGTENIISACLENNVKRLLHFSSVVTIGASFDGKAPLTENSPYNLKHLNLGYFETKRKAEDLVLDACKHKGLQATIVNPSTVYGPGDAQKGSRQIQVKVAQGQFPFYTPGGVNVISIHDVVSCTIEAFKKGNIGERYILAGENITIKTLFSLIAHASGVRAPSLPLPQKAIQFLGKTHPLFSRLGIKAPINPETAKISTLYHWFDSSKAQKHLGLSFCPAEHAIKESVEWMRTNGLLGKN